MNGGREMNSLSFFSLLARSFMLVPHIHSLNQNPAFCKENFRNLSGLSLILAGNDFYIVAFSNLHGIMNYEL